MSYHQVFSLLAGRPLAVTPAKLQAVTDFLQTRHEFNVDFSGVDIAATGENVLSAERQPSGSGIQYGDDIDVISVTGSLVNRSASGSSGMTNYRSLQRSIKRSLSDIDTGGIIFDFQTSGGMIVQCQATYNLIRQAAEIKPVISYIDAYAYSAGIYIACPADRVILGDANCSLGSVGVIAMHLDRSKQLEKEGLNYQVIKAGAKKDEYSSLKPLADPVLQDLQAGVERARLIFATDLASARGMSVDAVLDTEAGVFDGQDAIDVGFADEIASFEDTIGIMREMMSTRSNHYYMSAHADTAEVKMAAEGVNKVSGSGMNTGQRLASMLMGDQEGFKTAMQTLGFQSSEAVNTQFQDLRTEYFDKGKAEGLEEGKKLGLEQATEVLAQAELGQVSVAQAKGFVAQGLTQEEAGKKCQALKAAQSEGELGDSVTTGLTGDGPHPFLAYGEDQ
jgi:signal peptide peptidase SppA